jgi:glycosyltransferase involved in cell wall biosynthesis
VRAFARGPRDARLVIAGPDDERVGDGLRRLAVAEGVGDRVVVLGPLYGDAKLAALAAADVWALPSHTENFGIAVAEALAAGVATVVSPAVNLAGPAAAAGALVVAPAEPEEFGDALASLLRSPERRRALGERARSFVRQYESGVVALQLAQAYRDATARNGVAPLVRLAHA